MDSHISDLKGMRSGKIFEGSDNGLVIGPKYRDLEPLNNNFMECRNNNSYGNIHKIWLLIIFYFNSLLVAFAYDFDRTIDGYNYKLDTDRHQATFLGVGDTKVSDLMVPEEIEWKGDSYKVTRFFGYSYSNSDAKNLKQLMLPPSINYIRGLSNCSNLSEVYLPNSPLSIYMNAFERCESLEFIYIPEKVREIEMYAFVGCKNLRTVVLSTKDAEISETAFSVDYWLLESTNLKLIVLLSPTPPKYFKAFKNYIDDAILMVPKGCKAIYENSDWKYFDKILEFDFKLYNSYVPNFARVYSPEVDNESFLELPLNIMSFSYKKVIDECGCTQVGIDSYRNISKMLQKKGFKYRGKFKATAKDGDEVMECKYFAFNRGSISVRLVDGVESSQILIVFGDDRDKERFLRNSLKAGMNGNREYLYYEGTAESGILARVRGNVIQIADDGMGFIDILF